MALISIPEPWRKKVCAILKTEATGTLIRWTGDAERRFEVSFMNAWPYQVYPAFRSFLEGSNPMGCDKHMEQTGETYDFLFLFKEKTTYGKILLAADHKRILILSAHFPLKPKLSCE